MARKLTKEEINSILDFIQPQKNIPQITAEAVMNKIKKDLIIQLEKQLVYPEIIPSLKKEMIKQYRTTKIQAGESVGIVCAQSIGEMQTQTTLNSIDWNDKILYTEENKTFVEPIGKMIDNLLDKNTKDIIHIQENRTEYLSLPNGFMIPSTDKDGKMNWYKIEAITKHLPVGKLVKILTNSGRIVTATQSKSFLVWNGTEFEDTLGSDIKVGDILPTTSSLKAPETTQCFYMETIFPKSEYIYTTEINKAIKYQQKHGGLQSRTNEKFKELNGKEYTIPYNRYDSILGKRKIFFENCEEGFIYLLSGKIVSNIPDQIPLDDDFGFFVGLYLAEGWSTLTFVGIRNNDEKIRKRITNFCDRYGVTYHLVTSEGKNVRKGISNDLKIHSVLLARLFKKICDTGSANKKIPDFAYTAPKEFIRGLIDGYFSGDGSVDKNDGSVIVSSASEDLILGVSFLLSYFNIVGVLRNWQVKKNNVGSKNIKRTYNLRISNGNAQIFARNFILAEDNKQYRLQNITLKKDYRYINGKTQEKFPFDRDVYFDEVKSVEYVEGSTEFVYDLTVETTRNFQLWNGLNLHDTFHSAGASNKTMTTGVPRFRELIDATKNPKIVNNTIFFKKSCKTIQEIKKEVGNSITGLKFKDIIVKSYVQINKKSESWYDSFKILYSDRFSMFKDCVTFKVDKKKIYDNKLSLQQLAHFIEEEYDDLFCVFSPPEQGQIDVYVDTEQITLPEDRAVFIEEDNAISIYLEECVLSILENIYVCGIPAITEVFYTKKDGEWLVETNGINSKKISKQYSSFKKLLALPNIDYTKTISNNVWDIYEILDIEAARQFLIEEFTEVMGSGINLCHTSLLVDRMTHTGIIASITRYTLKNDEAGPCCKSSFEETLDNFLDAGAQGLVENTKGVSAAIMCGKRSEIGTGTSKITIDFDMLPSDPESDTESDTESDPDNDSE
jgi:DNA-directed RNA polymerase subunit A"